jgi:hypothetical protein
MRGLQTIFPKAAQKKPLYPKAAQKKPLYPKAAQSGTKKTKAAQKKPKRHKKNQSGTKKTTLAQTGTKWPQLGPKWPKMLYFFKTKSSPEIRLFLPQIPGLFASGRLSFLKTGSGWLPESQGFFLKSGVVCLRQGNVLQAVKYFKK